VTLGEPEVLDGSTRAAARPARAVEPFDAFYHRELPRLVALARALAGPAVADDLAQESMVAAYRHWARLAAYDSPEAWVRRVCVNRATSLLRRRAAETRALLRLGSRPEAVALAPEHEAVWDQVRRLPRRQAQAVALRYVCDLEVADVARAMGCSEGAVKVHLSRARHALAALLVSDGEEPA
jgi:RNA polymerase sigma-70 factor, ECF subfamily